MRFHGLVLALMIYARAFSQNDLPTDPPGPLTTPVGQPIGNSMVQKVDAKGGIIRSADNRLEVIFPAGAVDAETMVGIQPIHNEITDEDDGAFQLEPSGISFKMPVQLVFHYTGNGSADLKSIAWQDDKGQWHRSKSIQRDSVQKTVSCLTSHFSRWARFDQIYLSPRAATVKVNRTLPLHLVSLLDLRDRLGDEVSSAASESSADAELLAAPHDPHYYSGEWTVNGIAGGNSEVGAIARNGNRDAKYTSPAVVPDNNPVAVSVQIYSDDNQRTLLLTSNVTVIGDQYHFTFIHIDENGCYFLVDSSSCIFNMERHRVTIASIKNYPPWSDWPTSCDGCRWQWTNKESLKGLTEITGIASSQITPADASHPLANVNINFSPATGNTPSATTQCPQSPLITIPSRPYPAAPVSINFDIDGDDVVIHYGGKTGRNELVLEGQKYKTMIYIYKL